MLRGGMNDFRRSFRLQRGNGRPYCRYCEHGDVLGYTQPCSSLPNYVASRKRSGLLKSAEASADHLRLLLLLFLWSSEDGGISHR